VRLRIAEGVAGQDEFGGADRYRRYAGFFERGGEEARAQTFAVRGQAVMQGLARKNCCTSALRNVVKKILAEEAKVARDLFSAKRIEAQFAEHVEMGVKKMIGLP
jgi:hypothetical protein